MDPEKRPKAKRDVSLPIWGREYQWWTDAVNRQLKARGIDQKDLAIVIKEGAPAVSNCIRRVKPVYRIIIAISRELDIPYPMQLAETEALAFHLMEQKRMFKSDRQVQQIKAGVTEIPTESQTQEVRSDDEGRKGKRKRRPTGRRVRVG